MYVYPTRDSTTGQTVTIENAPMPGAGSQMRALLLELGFLVPLESYEPRYLSINTQDVLASLRKGDASWEDLVLPEVARVIKEKRLFGYAGSPGPAHA